MKEVVPDENETIAVKRSARLAEKFIRLRRSRIKSQRNYWWTDYHVEFILLLFLFLVNVYVVFPVLGTDAPEIPYSGPVIPLLGRLLEMTGVSLGRSYQFINIIFFLMFPMSMYYFVRVVTERKLPAFFAVLLASLPTYPFAEIRAHAAFFGGDAPHIVSLAFMPLALAFVLQFLQKGSFKYFVWSSLAVAFILLISAFGFLNFVIFACLICFSEMLLGSGRLKILRLLAILVSSVSLTSFWYNPGLVYWMFTSPFGAEIREMIYRLIPISLFSVPVLAAFGYLLFDRKPNLQSVFLASFFTIGFAIISLSGGGVFPGNPSRYVAELGLSLAFFISIVIVKLADYLKFIENTKFRLLTKPIFINGILIMIFLLSLYGILFGRESIHVYNDQVLGIWTGIDRGEIWEKRDTFGVFSTVFGYLITSSSVVSLGFLGSKMKKINHSINKKDSDEKEKK